MSLSFQSSKIELSSTNEDEIIEYRVQVALHPLCPRQRRHALLHLPTAMWIRLERPTFGMLWYHWIIMTGMTGLLWAGETGGILLPSVRRRRDATEFGKDTGA